MNTNDTLITNNGNYLTIILLEMDAFHFSIKIVILKKRENTPPTAKTLHMYLKPSFQVFPNPVSSGFLIAPIAVR